MSFSHQADLINEIHSRSDLVPCAESNAAVPTRIKVPETTNRGSRRLWSNPPRAGGLEEERRNSNKKR